MSGVKKDGTETFESKAITLTSYARSLDTALALGGGKRSVAAHAQMQFIAACHRLIIAAERSLV